MVYIYHISTHRVICKVYLPLPIDVKSDYTNLSYTVKSYLGPLVHKGPTKRFPMRMYHSIKNVSSGAGLKNEHRQVLEGEGMPMWTDRVINFNF